MILVLTVEFAWRVLLGAVVGAKQGISRVGGAYRVPKPGTAWKDFSGSERIQPITRSSKERAHFMFDASCSIHRKSG